MHPYYAPDPILTSNSVNQSLAVSYAAGLASYILFVHSLDLSAVRYIFPSNISPSGMQPPPTSPHGSAP